MTGSLWIAALDRQLDESGRRIWSDGYEKAFGIPPSRLADCRHLAFTFKETTLEIVARSFRVALRQEPYADVLEEVLRELLEE